MATRKKGSTKKTSAKKTSPKKKSKSRTVERVVSIFTKEDKEENVPSPYESFSVAKEDKKDYVEFLKDIFKKHGKPQKVLGVGMATDGVLWMREQGIQSIPKRLQGVMHRAVQAQLVLHKFDMVHCVDVMDDMSSSEADDLLKVLKKISKKVVVAVKESRKWKSSKLESLDLKYLGKTKEDKLVAITE